MAFHVRLSKHNVLKLSKVRVLPYATQADDKVFDRRHVIQLIDQSDKKHQVSNISRDIQHGTHLYMTSYRPHLISNTLNESSSVFHTGAVSKCFSVVVKSQEFDNQDSCENFRSRPCHCMSESRSRAFGGRKNCLPDECLAKSFLPVTLTDLQTMLLSSSLNSSNEETRFYGCVKPVSYTGDDILVEDDRCDIERVSDGMISRENHNVTILDQFFNTPGHRSSSLDAITVFFDGADTQTKKDNPKHSGPSKEQLIVVEKFFADTLPHFLKSRQDYRIYHKDIIFENNFWEKNTISQGINAYVMQMNKIRILTHFKYAHAQFHVLKITHHPEDGTVRIRWRISGLPQLKTLQIWKFMPWNYKKNRDSNSEWHDGFSIMTVGTDGLVQKHRVDRIMPDEELQTAKRVSLAAKLAILFGLSPKPSLNDFSSLFMKKPMLTPK